MTAIQDRKAHHYRLAVDHWTDDGVPVYKAGDAKMMFSNPIMGEAAWLSDQDELLVYTNLSSLTRPNKERDPLTMFRMDGSVAWTYPSPWTGVHGSHTAPKEKRGQLVGPLGVIGRGNINGVGEIFTLSTNVGTAEIMSADGLYIGRLFRDGRSAPQPWPEVIHRGMSLDDVTNGGEWFGGQFFQRADDGKFYVVCNRDAGVVAQVTGLDSVRRLKDQPLDFSQSEYEAARQVLADASGQAEQPKVLQIQPVDQAVDIQSQQRLRWPVGRLVNWSFDANHSAEAGWTYDKDNLYVYFKVQDASPMINSGEDVTQLFKFGDAAILELRTDAKQASGQAAMGDLRLLFSVNKGKPIAVLYDYHHPGAEHPIDFQSVMTTRIDRVEVLKDAEVNIERSQDGYTLRAAVPLTQLDNWHPQAGVSYPGDFGIVYSDQQGTTNQLRMYWSNKATGIVSDLSLEAAIQPENWGHFEVK